MSSSRSLTNIFFLRDCFAPKPIPARINPGMGSQRDANRPNCGRCGASDAVPGGLTATMIKAVEAGTAPTVTVGSEIEHCASGGETEQVHETTMPPRGFC